jgi:hypothetical protein
VSTLRALVYGGLLLLLAGSAFMLGTWTAHRATAEQLAESDAHVSALRAEVARSTARARTESVAITAASQSALVEEIKRQLQSEMGLVPVRLLRERRSSFVELHTVDSLGRSGYGTAGYLGDGYFITVKHGVAILEDKRERQGHRMVSITLRYRDRDVAATVVDAGDADAEVHPGDWALLKVDQPVDLPPLAVDTGFAYDFAEPIFRLGNDYSKGIAVSTGYVGQRTANGLVTCLTDGHPGVSGGGVLNGRGDLVGIPIGRMQQDFRFSFILPLRAEMFRAMPRLAARPGPAPLPNPLATTSTSGSSAQDPAR